MPLLARSKRSLAPALAQPPRWLTPSRPTCAPCCPGCCWSGWAETRHSVGGGRTLPWASPSCPSSRRGSPVPGEPNISRTRAGIQPDDTCRTHARRHSERSTRAFVAPPPSRTTAPGRSLAPSGDGPHPQPTLVASACRRPLADAVPRPAHSRPPRGRWSDRVAGSGRTWIGQRPLPGREHRASSVPAREPMPLPPDLDHLLAPFVPRRGSCDGAPGTRTDRGPTRHPPVAVAAVLFGASAPASRIATETSAPVLAGLLYIGAAVAVTPSVLHRGLDIGGAPCRGAPRLAIAVGVGGLLDLFLAAGFRRGPRRPLRRCSSISSWWPQRSSRSLFREHLGPRVSSSARSRSWPPASSSRPSRHSRPSARAVPSVGACICWGLDYASPPSSTASRPEQITIVKGVVAGGTNLLLGLALGGSLPSGGTTAGVCACHRCPRIRGLDHALGRRRTRPSAPPAGSSSSRRRRSSE